MKKTTFASRLKSLRLQAGLSVSQLAERSKLNRTFLHNLEAGLRIPTLRVAIKLTKTLGVSLSTFDEIDFE